MVRENDIAAEAAVDTYQPQVQVVKKSDGEAEEFWARLLREAEEADELDASVFTAPEVEEELAPFDERYEKLMGVVSNKPSHREILIRTLSFCKDERAFEEVEEAIQGYPEFASADQNPYRLITYLVDGGGLALLEVDTEGALVDTTRKVGLTEDGIDDLVAAYHLKATDVGEKLADDLAPSRRLQDLLSLFTDRVPFYNELLEFCKQPRRFKDIEALFSGRDLSALKTLHPESGLAIKPTVFVDNMEKAGAIVWKKDGWVLTKAGEAYLKTLTGGPL